MNWNLKCRRTEQLLALHAGNDLDEASQLATQRHLAGCPRCREFWKGLQASQTALVLVQESAVASSGGVASVWPDVQRQIRVLEAEARAADWRMWLPSGALAAACLAVAVLLSSDRATLDAVTRNPRLPSHSMPIVMPLGALPSESFSQGIWQERFDHDDRRPVRYLLDGTDVSRL